LKRIKPEIIMYQGSGYGRTGPFVERPAYAEIVEAFDGSSYLNGYPGGDPNTVGVAPWMDAGQAMHGAFAIICALYHREQTGEGQQIDGAMIEGSANFLGEAIMDAIMNERVSERMGNRDPVMAPHGAYRCKGEYSWVAIAVSNDDEWVAMRKVMGDPQWAKSARFADQLSRWKNQDELDAHIQAWTKNRDAYEVTDMLQRAGVMAGPSLSPKDLVEDPQIKYRGFMVENDHPVIGHLSYAGLAFRLSNAPRGNYGPAPLLGEHNNYVLGTLLGMSDSEIEGFVREKVLL
jgi:crotonobetainyl-CoA:carnitine CoA-transferase CaiB-like acyl-CoA transferase